MSEISSGTLRTRPAKPYPEFPLFAGPNGQWRKDFWSSGWKRSIPYYFGSWRDDPSGIRALGDYKGRKEAIADGSETKPPPSSRTAKQIRRKYLSRQREARDNEKRRQTYDAICKPRAEVLATVRSENGCVVCGSSDAKALVFHHVEPRTKAFSLAHSCTRSFDSVLHELGKCVVVCRSHHNQHHRGGMDLPLRHVVVAPAALAQLRET